MCGDFQFSLQDFANQIYWWDHYGRETARAGRKKGRFATPELAEWLTGSPTSNRSVSQQTLRVNLIDLLLSCCRASPGLDTSLEGRREPEEFREVVSVAGLGDWVVLSRSFVFKVHSRGRADGDAASNLSLLRRPWP